MCSQPVLIEIKCRQRNAQQKRFNQSDLLPITPDEAALEIRRQIEITLLNLSKYLANCEVLRRDPNTFRIPWFHDEVFAISFLWFDRLLLICDDRFGAFRLDDHGRASR